MTRHRVTAVALIVPLVLTAACTSSTKHPSANTASNTTGTSGATSGGGASLAASMSGPLRALSSTAITIDAGGLIATTSGHITLHNGAATASEFTIGTGSDATTVITIGTTAYAKLPAGENTSGKAYLKVSANSSNEFVRGLAADVQILQTASSLGDLVGLVPSATGFTDDGTTTIGGASAHHYSFSVSGNAHGSTFQQQLAEITTTPVPVDLYINAQDLPIKIVLAVKLGGSSIPVTASLGDFNAPVTITAPPANEVAGG